MRISVSQRQSERENLRVQFAGEMEGARGRALKNLQLRGESPLHDNKNGPTEFKLKYTHLLSHLLLAS